jgi:hypothetical protein
MDGAVENGRGVDVAEHNACRREKETWELKNVTLWRFAAKC